MPTTPTYALPYPALADPADVPADLSKLANRIETVIAPGTVSGQVPVWDNAAKTWVAQAQAPNADTLDGLDATAFLGVNAKAADADKLDGLDSTAFLGVNAKAADADKLDGLDSTAFLGGAPLSATPPATPIDGQIWAMLADASNGVVWLFRYRAASTSPYKWEFVGGPPLNDTRDVHVYTAQTVYVGNPTNIEANGVPTLTLQRAGEYWVTVAAYIDLVANGGGYLSIFGATTSVNDADGAGANLGTGVVQANFENTRKRTFTQGAVVSTGYRSVTASFSAGFAQRKLSIVPIRVS
jgi:hypothetical protein